MICKDCLHCIKTRQMHNGDEKDIRNYVYCNEIYIDEFEMDNVIECEAFKPKAKANRTSKEVDDQRDKALESGKEPRKKHEHCFNDIGRCECGIHEDDVKII